MELELSHAVARPLADIERDLLDGRFVARLAAAARPVAEGTLLAITPVPGGQVRKARFVVAPAYRGGPLLRLARLAWTEEVRWDAAAHRGTVRVEPEAPAPFKRLIRCEGSYTLVPDGDGARRLLRVSIDVRAPLVGREIERRLERLLRDLFDDEAALLARPA